MPSLVLFGQKTPVGGDDLRVFALFTLILKLVQGGFAIALFYRTNEVVDLFDRLLLGGFLQDSLEECLDEGGSSQEKVESYRTAYLSLTIVLAICGIVFGQSIWVTSGMGSPTNGHMMGGYCGEADRQRSATLRGLCHFHLTVLYFIRIITAVFGNFFYTELDVTCDCILAVQWSDFDLNVLTSVAIAAPGNITAAEEAYLRESQLFCGKQGTWDELLIFLITSHYVEVALNSVVIAYVLLQAIRPAFVRGIAKVPILPRALDSESRWKLFCRCCCTLTSVASCCLMGGQEAAVGDFTELAVLLSDFFNYNNQLDIVASDIVCGMVLLQRVQAQQVQENRRELLEHAKTQQSKPKIVVEVDDEAEEVTTNKNPGQDEPEDPEAEAEESKRRVMAKVKETQSLTGITYRLKRYEGADTTWEAHVTKLLDAENENDRLHIAEGARFMRLSLAIYTWIMYSIDRPCTGMCTICCGALARDCQKQQSDTPTEYYPGDGRCCRLHSTAFMKEAGIEESEIAYAYFRAGVVEAPYAIVLDHEWKSIVIICRGTLSLEDVLTDLTIQPTSLEDVGKACGFDGSLYHAHGGMLATCQWMMDHMREHNTLERLFAQDSRYKEYRLRVTGHSLGAGVAAILAVMLRPTYPTLRCHSFSPPGCTLSENAAEDCKDYITSYVLDADIIPRASLNALENLRHDLVDIISRIKVPKNQVFDEYVLGCSQKSGNELDEFLYKEEEIPDSLFLREWREYRRVYDERKTRHGDLIVELYAPGKIIQLFPSGDDGAMGDANMATTMSRLSNCCTSKAKPQFVSRWAHRLDFRAVRVAHHLLDDHIPSTVLMRLEDEAERFGLVSPFLEREAPEQS